MAFFDACARFRSIARGYDRSVSGPPKLRTALRVVKYDPALRDRRGIFGGDDWTAISDVGSTFNGRTLKLHEYLDVEAKYLRVVSAFLSEAATQTTVAMDVQPNAARWSPAEREPLSLVDTTDVVRDMLRERLFCRLAGDNDVYVHVGYDFYLYLGGNVPSARTLEIAAEVGLFVDQDFTSPYHIDPATGEAF